MSKCCIFVFKRRLPKTCKLQTEQGNNVHSYVNVTFLKNDFFPPSAVSVCSSFKQRRRSTHHNKFQSRDSSSKSVMLGEDSCHEQPSASPVRMTHFPKRISIFRWPQKDKCDPHASAAALIFVSLKHYSHLGVTTSRLRCMTLTCGRGPKDTAQCRNRRRKVGRVNQLYCSLDYTDIWSGGTRHGEIAHSPFQAGPITLTHLGLWCIFNP